MKNRRFVHFSFLLLGLCIKSATVVAQHSGVQNAPKEIRKLPNSFKEDYQGKEYDYVESISWVDKLEAWAIDLLKSWFTVKDENASNILENLEILFYFIIIIGVVYIIAKMILRKEGRWLFSRKKEEASSLEYEIGENIQEVNFDVLIKEALQNQDYRLAVRYNYLLLLKKLDQFGVISYDAQKTTYDYSLDLEGSSYSTGFNKATYYYTYIWYGEFTIDEQEYKTASTVYAQILKSFKNA